MPRNPDRSPKSIVTGLRRRFWMLDVDQLPKNGCLQPGCSSTCQWTDGNEVVSINLRAEAERLHLSYTVRVGDREWRDVTDTIAIVHLPCRFGGSRAYFICPGPRGTDCGRRTTKLHLSGRYFLCRHCNHLPYACQYENSWQRALRRTNKLKQRLDMGVGLAEGGLLSGRGKDRTRKTVESYRALDVNQLSEKGCLRPGCSSTCQWTDGNEVFSINPLRLSGCICPIPCGLGIGNGDP